MIALFLLILVPQGARAQETDAEPGERHVAPAIGLALANTAIPLAVFLSDEDYSQKFLLFYSWVVGPFPGLIYAGDADRGLEGVGVRLLTAGLAAVISYADYLAEFGGDSSSGADALLIVPAGLTVVSWISDIAAIPPAIKGQEESVTLSPMVGSGGQVGVRVQIRW
jgi:hypothetical protein